MGYDNAPSGEMVTHRAHSAKTATGRDSVGGDGKADLSLEERQESLAQEVAEAESSQATNGAGRNNMVSVAPVATANAKQKTRPIKNHVA